MPLRDVYLLFQYRKHINYVSCHFATPSKPNEESRRNIGKHVGQKTGSRIDGDVEGKPATRPDVQNVDG